MELSGRLSSFPIGELLMWAKNERRSGALVLRRTSREKRIYFAEGQVRTCLTNQTAEFYGQHLLLSGVLEEDVLRDSINRCRAEGKRLGAVLAEMELLEPAEIARTLSKHNFDVVLDIFLWEHGIFFFEDEPPPTDEILARPIDPLELVFEGTQWKGGYSRLRETFPHDQVILARDMDLPGFGHQPRHRQIFAEVNGRSTLATIYDKVAGSYYRFLQATFDLYQDGFLKIVDVGEAMLQGTVELPLRELLFEEAEREQRDSARLYASPVGPFLRYVPVWVRRPAKEEWDQLPAEVKRLYLQFDGTRRLEDILAEDGKWRLQTELLMLQVKQEAVAFLPAPATELRDQMKQLGTEQERWWKQLLGSGEKTTG